MGASERNLLLVVPGARWSVAPIPKVASTLLKRLAVIAAGRKPQELVTFGETRPALAIHRADVHQLPSFADLTHQEQEQLVADPHGLRLSVTRHPGERLLSFWHDKLHLADPAYAPLNASVQSECGLDAASPCASPTFWPTWKITGPCCKAMAICAAKSNGLGTEVCSTSGLIAIS